MSFWNDFGAGFFSDQARQMQQAEQLSIAEAIERRRMQWEEERADRKRKQALQDQINLANVQAEPTPGWTADGKGALLRRQIDYDPETGKMSRRDETVGPLLMRATGKLKEIKRGDQFVTKAEYSDGLTTEWREEETAPRYKPDSGRGGSSVPRDERGFTPGEAERFRREDEKAARDARAQWEAGLKAKADADIKRLDAIESKDWEAKPDGVIPAARRLEQDLGLPRTLRSPAQARRAIEERYKPGGSRDTAIPYNFTDPNRRPPKGTWVELPDGNIVQIQ